MTSQITNEIPIYNPNEFLNYNDYLEANGLLDDDDDTEFDSDDNREIELDEDGFQIIPQGFDLSVISEQRKNYYRNVLNRALPSILPINILDGSRVTECFDPILQDVIPLQQAIDEKLIIFIVNNNSAICFTKNDLLILATDITNWFEQCVGPRVKGATYSYIDPTNIFFLRLDLIGNKLISFEEFKAIMQYDGGIFYLTDVGKVIIKSINSVYILNNTHSSWSCYPDHVLHKYAVSLCSGPQCARGKSILL